MTGSRANTELAATLNAAVRTSTQWTICDDRAYRKPPSSDSVTRLVSLRSTRGRFQRYRKRITPVKPAAFMRNATPQLVAAITNPPRAGPTARATLNAAELRATAVAWFRGEATSGVMACHA